MREAEVGRVPEQSKKQDPVYKITKAKRTGGVAQVI
jgi:hypothetical protein